MPRPGPRRKPLNARVSDAGRELVQKRADAEVTELPPGKNLSEMARRLIAYGVVHMPVGWTPEKDAEQKEPAT